MFFQKIVLKFVRKIIRPIKPDYVILGGMKNLRSIVEEKGTPEGCVINGHALDYNEYLDDQSPCKLQDYAVFLDQNLPYHPDFIASNETTIKPELYFKQMRDYFDFFEESQGIKIKIAASPRSNYSNKSDVFGKREIILEEIMTEDPILVPVSMDQEDIAYLFEQYDLTSAPVVNAQNRLIGMITVDDVDYSNHATLFIGRLHHHFESGWMLLLRLPLPRHPATVEGPESLKPV